MNHSGFLCTYQYLFINTNIYGYISVFMDVYPYISMVMVMVISDGIIKVFRDDNRKTYF